jgi:diguanylate cyclase (GGDEF)-like protein
LHAGRTSAPLSSSRAKFIVSGSQLDLCKGAQVLVKNNDTTTPDRETVDHRAVQQSLRLLDEITTVFWWNTVVMISLLMIALVAVLQPQLTSYLLGKLEIYAFLRGLIFLALVSSAYALYHQQRFKSFRDRLAGQMQGGVKERMRAEKFYGMAILDPLTGLYNRRYGEECLQKEIARAEKNSYELAALVLDLDYFKQINDKFGHAAGDLVLKEFARHLRRAIRACDVPVRIGGDEFIVVLPECPRENVHIILSRLKPFEVMVDRRRITVSYSRGNAQYQVGDTIHSMLQRADKVLYAEKAARSTALVRQ